MLPLDAVVVLGGSSVAITKDAVRGQCAVPERPPERPMAGMQENCGRRDGQDRAPCMGQAVAAHPAGKDTSQGGAPACPDDEQVASVSVDDGKNAARIA